VREEQREGDASCVSRRESRLDVTEVPFGRFVGYRGRGRHIEGVTHFLRRTAQANRGERERERNQVRLKEMILHLSGSDNFHIPFSPKNFIKNAK